LPANIFEREEVMTISRICPGCGETVEGSFYYHLANDSLDCPRCRKRFRLSDGAMIPSYSEEAKNREPARTVKAIDFEAEKAAKLAKD
jgi:hypothetical protein